MAREPETGHRSPTQNPTASSDDFSLFAHEDAQDNRILKVSLWGAVAFHVALLLINFPSFYSKPLAENQQEQQVFVVKPIRFKQPTFTKPIPEKRVKRVPAPDPTPDEPEPLRSEEPQVVLDLPDVDPGLLAIPNAPPAPDPPDGPIRVGGEVDRPIKVHAPQPRYTEIARKARVQGRVIMEAIIDRHGNVTNVTVLKGLPMGLSEESVKAVKQWKFKPATLHGKPVDVYFTLTVTFQLQ